jgi:acyl-CoA reductase-like NAD-dependent aldehyde dehydrogenase
MPRLSHPTRGPHAADASGDPSSHILSPVQPSTREGDATWGLPAATDGSFASRAAGVARAAVVAPLASLDARLRWLDAFASILRRDHQRLCDTVADELGKADWETTLTEVLPLLASVTWHRKHLRRVVGPQPLRGAAWWQRGDRVRLLRAPVGRVLIIATWNYPIQLAGIQIVQSIAGGNETWLKPSERSPRSQALLVDGVREALEVAGLPRELLQVAEATRAEGERLLREVAFDHVLFTGSTAVGRRIAATAAATLTPTTLELSGQDSAIVLGDADPRLAALSIFQAVTMNAGQTCMAPRRALVDRRAMAAFLDALAPLVAAGQPLRMVDEPSADRVERLAREAVSAGGRSLVGHVEPREGNRLRPIAIADCPTDTDLFAGDHFGPAIAITPVDGLDHALALHAGVGQALATSVFTRDAKAIESRAADFGSSFVTVNDCVRPTAHPAAAIEGRGPSGWGASRGRAGLEALTRSVTVTTRGLLTPPAETPSPSLLAWIRRFARLSSAHR